MVAELSRMSRPGGLGGASGDSRKLLAARRHLTMQHSLRALRGSREAGTQRAQQRPWQHRQGVPALTATGASPSPDPAVPNPGGRDESASSTGASAGLATTLLLRAVVQVAVLAVALAALILLPAHLSGRLAAGPAPAGAGYALYLLFFASGTVSRMLRYGQLAPRKEDRQLATGGSRLAFALFLLAVPTGHYLAWWDGSLAMAAGSGGRAAAALRLALPALGYTFMLAGWALNAAAAAALGKAYNRLVAPDRLVTSGPFAWVQHPIYTSYMLLFCGYCLSLGSPMAAVALLLSCLVYYRSRTHIEEQLLEATFGEEYRQYRSRTGRFLPCVLPAAT